MAIESNALDILTLADVDTEDVTFPATGYGAWGGRTFRIRSISAAEREDLLRGSVVIDGKVRKFDAPTMRVRIVCLAVIDEDGNRVFKDSQMAQLGKKSAKAIDFLADVAMRLAGLGDDEADAEGKGPSSESASDSSTA